MRSFRTRNMTPTKAAITKSRLRAILTYQNTIRSAIAAPSATSITMSINISKFLSMGKLLRSGVIGWQIDHYRASLFSPLLWLSVLPVPRSRHRFPVLRIWIPGHPSLLPPALQPFLPCLPFFPEPRGRWIQTFHP